MCCTSQLFRDFVRCAMCTVTPSQPQIQTETRSASVRKLKDHNHWHVRAWLAPSLAWDLQACGSNGLSSNYHSLSRHVRVDPGPCLGHGTKAVTRTVTHWKAFWGTRSRCGGARAGGVTRESAASAGPRSPGRHWPSGTYQRLVRLDVLSLAGPGRKPLALHRRNGCTCPQSRLSESVRAGSVAGVSDPCR